jgi:hypothetical protein
MLEKSLRGVLLVLQRPRRAAFEQLGLRRAMIKRPASHAIFAIFVRDQRQLRGRWPPTTSVEMMTRCDAHATITPAVTTPRLEQLR